MKSIDRSHLLAIATTEGIDQNAGAEAPAKLAFPPGGHQAEQEHWLDEALAGTFPASDPVSWGHKA